MLKFKTALKLAPSTRDEEYDRRKRELKDFDAAMRHYRSSMEKSKMSIRRVVEAFAEVCKAFDALSDNVNTPDCTKDCARALSSSVERIDVTLKLDFNTTVDLAVLSAIHELKILYDECGNLEVNRNKLMNTYDAHRHSVAKKESDYKRKSKDLRSSKSYCAEAARRDQLEGDFEAADRKFKDAHDHLIQKCAITSTKTLNAFVNCTLRFMEGTSREFEVLRGSVEQAVQVLHYGMCAD
ncbi:hypothetical protein LSCM1_04581 [Leishmania martiniquensis]|uniref:BAR domain-containing protein n=1 Tax=Leishmania martiniquensis TaxID=1580590 RepID=A0A836H844_9TRYP|nr:hypothetical protein LSCM1_04581 [Leishmania martiniquensis]